MVFGESLPVRLQQVTAEASATLDLIIVGSRPAGFSASLGAMKHKLRFHPIEQNTLGGTIYHFPRSKEMKTRPTQLPLVGKVKITDTSKEKLLEFWQTVERDFNVKIHYNERLETVTKRSDGFVVRTTAGERSGDRLRGWHSVDTVSPRDRDGNRDQVRHAVGA